MKHRAHSPSETSPRTAVPNDVLGAQTSASTAVPNALFGALVFLIAIAPSALRAVEPISIDPETGLDAKSYSEQIDKTIHGYTISSSFGPVDTPLPLEMANFLLDHPDLSALLVRRHEIAPYSISMRAPRQSWADDGEGTAGLITLVNRREQTRIYFGDGIHKSRLFPTVHAAAVIYMDIEQKAGPGCRPHIRTVFQVYVRLKNPIVSTFVKALRPFLRNKVGHIFTKAFLVADKVGRLMAQHPQAISNEILSSTLISSEDRAAFFKLIPQLNEGRALCP